MKRFYILVSLLFVLILVGGVVVFSKKSSAPTEDIPLPESYEYFWGEGCTHCAKVEEFLSSWENIEKVEIDKKEVYNNTENVALFRSRAQYCELANNQVGVPFLFTPDGECIIGDTPIIDYFADLEFEE